MGEQTYSSNHWTKNSNSYLTMHDQGLHPAYVFREIKDGETREKSAQSVYSNTYHHALTRSTNRSFRPLTASFK